MDVSKIDIYAKPFVVEDENMEGIIPARVCIISFWPILFSSKFIIEILSLTLGEARTHNLGVNSNLIPLSDEEDTFQTSH